MIQYLNVWLKKDQCNWEDKFSKQITQAMTGSISPQFLEDFDDYLNDITTPNMIRQDKTIQEIFSFLNIRD